MNFETKLLSDMHHRITYLYINFQQNRVSRSVKTVTQVYLQILANCINLQLAIRISKNHAFRTCTTPSRTFRPILSSIGLLDNKLPRKEIISTDGRTDVAHEVQKCTAYTWLDCCCSTQHKLYSLLLLPAMGARFYRFLGRPAKWTRWLAGAAAIKSG